MFSLARTLAVGGLVLFAWLGFTRVPLGDKTAWDRTRQLASDPQAEKTLRSVFDTVQQLRAQLWGTRQPMTEGDPTSRHAPDVTGHVQRRSGQVSPTAGGASAIQGFRE